MNIEPIDTTDAANVEQLLEIQLAAHAADEPDNPAPCRVAFRADFTSPPPDRQVRHYGVLVDGRIVGYTDLHLPIKENLHFGFANVVVHPRHRRGGIGRALVEHGMRVTRELGRRTFNVDVVGDWEGGPKRPEAGRRLLEQLGFTLALTEVNRISDISALDPAAEQRLLDDSLAASSDYETIAYHGAVPEELLAPLAKLNSTFMTEAPLGELDLEAEKIDADRVRANQERSRARGLAVCGVVARRVGETDLVANTDLAVTTEPGDVAWQWMTLVDPKHRGHRLGMRVKVENLRQLRALHPAVRRVVTGNADVNPHMIAINEALGFRPVDASYEYQIDVTKTS